MINGPGFREAAPIAENGGLPQTVEGGTLALESVSVFKSGAEEKVAALLKIHGENRLRAFRAFMMAELKERVEGSASGADKSSWEDAGNVFTGVFMCIRGDTLVNAKDVELLMEDLKAIKEGKTRKADIAKVDTLVNVYLAARRRIFPEFAFHEKSPPKAGP